MSTTKTIQATNQYNPQSMNTFNQLQPQLGSLFQQYMQNPLGVVNPTYNLSGQMAQQNAARLGQSGMQNLQGNMAATGFSGVNLPAYMQSQIAAQGRATSSLEANAFLQNELARNQAAIGVQQFGASGAGSYSPLQTGGTGKESQGGLGTWLPQVIGTGLSMLMKGGAMGL